jgi:hypothetical protein
MKEIKYVLSFLHYLKCSYVLLNVVPDFCFQNLITSLKLLIDMIIINIIERRG